MKSPIGKFMAWVSLGLVVAALALSGCEPDKKKKTDTSVQQMKANNALMVMEMVQGFATTATGGAAAYSVAPPANLQQRSAWMERLASSAASARLTPAAATVIPLTTVPCASGSYDISGNFNVDTSDVTYPIVTPLTMNFTMVFSSCAEPEGTLSGTFTLTANDSFVESDPAAFPYVVTVNLNESETMSNIALTGPFGSVSIGSAAITVVGSYGFSVDASSNFTLNVNLTYTVTVDGATCSATLTNAAAQPAWTCS